MPPQFPWCVRHLPAPPPRPDRLLVVCCTCEWGDGPTDGRNSGRDRDWRAELTVDGGFVRVSPLEESWRRFTGWLEREAPASHDCLNPPALPADIEAAEAANGARFPEDLRQL